MRKTIMTILGSALLAASLTQAAAAAERHKVRKVVRPHAPVSDQFRNSNDYYVPEFRNSNDYYAAPSGTWTQPGFYEDGRSRRPLDVKRWMKGKNRSYTATGFACNDAAAIFAGSASLGTTEIVGVRYFDHALAAA